MNTLRRHSHPLGQGQAGREGGTRSKGTSTRQLSAVRSIAVALLMLAASACQNRDTTANPPAPSGRAGGSQTSHDPISAEDFGSASFESSAEIDNQWFTLQPGTQWVLEGHALDDGERISRRVVATVTDLTKEIGGVRARIVWELDYTEGELEEAEIALFAQDVDGNVWHMGEYPVEYDGGEIVKTPAWIAGLAGARAGIAMPAEPRVGTPSYAQGWGPQVGWNDRGETYRMGEGNCVPVDCYEDVLVTREFSRTEPGAFQLKYYAPGVGNIRVGWEGPKEEEKEEMVLRELTRLSPEALAQVRAKVLEQEGLAYTIGKGVYGRTPPAEQSVSG